MVSTNEKEVGYVRAEGFYERLNNAQKLIGFCIRSRNIVLMFTTLQELLSIIESYIRNVGEKDKIVKNLNDAEELLKTASTKTPSGIPRSAMQNQLNEDTEKVFKILYDTYMIMRRAIADKQLDMPFKRGKMGLLEEESLKEEE